MPPDPGHGLGQFGDRVVGLQHRPVPGRPARGEPDPGHALLRGLDQVEAAPADRGAEPADLADRLGDAVEQFRVVVHQPAGAPGPARLLVGDERQHHVARRAAALPQALPDHREHHRVHVLHVHRAAAPDAPVLGIAGERVHPPVARIRGDHVQMAVDEQGGPRLILALDPGHDAGAFRVRLQHDRLQADLGEQFRDVLGGRALPGAGVVARIRGVDPDQVAGDGGDLILRGRAGRAAGSSWVIPTSSHRAPGDGSRAARLPSPWPPACRGGAAPSAWPTWSPAQSPVAAAARICYRDAASPASAVARTRPGGGIGRRASLRC